MWWHAAFPLASAGAPGDLPSTSPVCVERLDRGELAIRVDEAERAWLDLDTERFRDRMNVLSGLVVPCLGDLVPSDLSARWHRVMALQLDGLGDAAGADGAIRAALAVDGSIAFDDTWVGADHHLRAAFGVPGSDRSRKVPEPRSGSVAFDGVATRARPLERPSLVQVFDAGGVARATAYLGPKDPLPAYAAVPRRRNALLISAGASLAASGVLVGLGYSEQAELFRLARDPGISADRLTAQRRTTDLLAGLGYGFGGLAAGLGAGAAVVGQR